MKYRNFEWKFDTKLFGKVLTVRRAILGHTTDEFGSLIGFSKSFVGQLERGSYEEHDSHPHISNVLQICTFAVLNPTHYFVLDVHPVAPEAMGFFVECVPHRWAFDTGKFALDLKLNRMATGFTIEEIVTNIEGVNSPSSYYNYESLKRASPPQMSVFLYLCNLFDLDPRAYFFVNDRR